MELTTRLAGDADIEVISRLWSIADAARRESVGVPVDMVAAKAARSRLRASDALAIVVEEPKGPVGMAVAVQAREHDGRSPHPVPGLAHVSMVAVHPARWGLGIGTVAVRAIEHHARERGYARAQLWTHESNRRGRRLYERLGWVPSGRAKVDDAGEPVRHYTREL